MNEFLNELNNVLVETFRSVLRVEEQMLKNTSNINLTISELHLIEAVGKDIDKGRTISDIAEDLDITLPSVTIAINKLLKKGYVEKVRCDKDGRVVFVTLTRQGQKVNSAHQFFHRQMVREVSKGLSEEEKDVMLKGIKALNSFFKKKALPKE